MADFQQLGQATHNAVSRLNFASWERRLSDMMEHASRYRYTDGSTANSRLRVDRVSKDWPRSGAVFVTREVDNAKVRLYLKGDKFKVEVVRAERD